MAFEFEKKVRFGEIDEAGIVYYPRFFDYYHLAMEEFFDRGVGIPYADIVKKWRVGFPAVHVEADFLIPLKYGDTMIIAVAITKVGRSSVRMKYRVRRAGDDTRVSEARLTTVCVDMDTFRSRNIPDELRLIFDRFLDDGTGEIPDEMIVR